MHTLKGTSVRKTVDYYLNLKREEKRIKKEIEGIKSRFDTLFANRTVKKMFGMYDEGVEQIEKQVRTVNVKKFSNKVSAQTFLNCISVKVKDAEKAIGIEDLDRISTFEDQTSIIIIKK